MINNELKGGIKMELKQRTKIILELGITDEIGLIARIMKNLSIKNVNFIEPTVLKVEYNDGNTWTLTLGEMEDVQNKRFVKFE